MTRVIEYLINLSQFNDLSRIKHGNSVSNVCNDAKVVRDEYDCILEFLLKVFQELQYLRLDCNVQSRCRLVADKNLRLTGKRYRDNYSLSHSSGILEGVIVETVFRIRYADFFHENERAGSRLNLRALLVLHDDGGYLLEGCHRILEDRCDLLSADLPPVLRILNLCKVDNAGTMELFIRFVKISDSEHR